MVSAHPGMSLKQANETYPHPADGFDIVIVSFGGNNPPPTKAIARSYMNRMLTQIGSGKQVAWITVLPASDPELQVARARMESWQKDYLPTKGVTVLDGRTLASGIRRADGLHLTSGGYRVFAARVADAIALSGGISWKVSVGAGVLVGLLAAALKRSGLLRQRQEW